MSDYLSGGEILIRALSDVGVEYVFGYPGGAALHIYDAIFKQQAVEHILARHEQAAAHMADGYARATGEVGVVLVTSGPGATNTITGIATAYMDSIPMVVISGQVPKDVIGTDAFQETDMIGVSRPVVKHSYVIQDASEIARVVKEAFHIARTGRPGPVVIDVPKDTTDPNVEFEYDFPEEVDIRSYRTPNRGHTGQIREAVQMIRNAQRPIVYYGGGVVQGNASEELIELAENIGCPVTSTLMGLGAFPAEHEQFIGMLGMHGTYEANCAMHYSDLIIAIGARFDDRVTNNPEKFCPNARIVHIDIDPASISKIIPATVPIVGHCRAVLRQMNQVLDEDQLVLPKYANAGAVWWARVNAWRDEHGLDHDQRKRQGRDGALLPQQVVQAIYRKTKGEAYVTSDVGLHQMFAAQYYKFPEPRRWINSGGLGTMGFGFPAAMGVQFAFPHETVVCITGEGSFMMNMQELSTCMQYALPIKIINLNNQSLGMVRQWQDMQYGGRHSHSTYQEALPDFKELIRSFKHLAFQAFTLDELDSAIEHAFAAENKHRLVFIDAMVDPEEHVYPMSVKGGSLLDMVLEKAS